MLLSNTNNGAHSGDGRHDALMAGEYVYARFADVTGRVMVLQLSPKQAEQIRSMLENGGGPIKAHIRSDGSITRITQLDELDYELAANRFRLDVSPLEFTPCVPSEWANLLDEWLESDSPVWVLFYGPEGTGKDTLAKIFIERLEERQGAENIEIFWLPPEEDDRYVGHLETKLLQLASLIRRAKAEGKFVVLYLPEIASWFCTGHITAAWHKQFEAFFRNILDGAQGFGADAVIAHSNTLVGLGGPTVSRFKPVPIKMTRELAEGIMRAHWPEFIAADSAPDQVLDYLYRQDIARGRLARGQIVYWKAHELTGFNGRFIARFCKTLGQRVKRVRREHKSFEPDLAFMLGLLKKELSVLIDHLREAARERRLHEILVDAEEMVEPVVEVTPTLEWCDQAEFIVM